MPTCRECGIVFPNRIKIDGIVHILHRREFCLKCSPLGAHNTSSYGYKKNRVEKCIICGKETTDRRRMFCEPNGKCDAIYTFAQKRDLGKIAKRETVRRYLLFTREHLCARCGNTEWLGNEIPIETHHKDGNYKNNEEQNLELLCPNCHSVTDNYRGKNRGNGRGDYNGKRK